MGLIRLLAFPLCIIVFYLIITPLALALRLTGRDKLALRYRAKQASCWVQRQGKSERERYFRPS
ncbi:MAG: hypothetical protein GKR94_25310 [Gammaproteobacteria bacterium]|nr:hypothetical protein [Gammaproteobacteria bacterium]